MYFFFFKQKTAYEMRISDWSSDVCSSDLKASASPLSTKLLQVRVWRGFTSPIWQRGAADHSEPRSCSTSRCGMLRLRAFCSASNFISFDLNEHAHPEKRKARQCWRANLVRSEEHTSELQSLMSISDACFCYKK